jgi:cell division transport system permease protein
MANSKPARPQRAKRKQRLATNEQKHGLLTQARIIRYGFRNFSRNAWLTIAATVVMTITLVIIFATAIASHVMSETITTQQEKIDISIYFKPETSDDVLRRLKGKLQIVQNVSSVDVSNSQQEYQKAVEEQKNDPTYLQGLEDSAAIGTPVQFSAVIHVKLRNFNDRTEVDNLIKNDDLFKEWYDTARNESNPADTRQNTVKRLSEIMSFAQTGGIGAAVVFIIISVMIIFNTIRMAIFSRRDEIEMMKAIGADQHFIRGPFLVEARLYGLIAAVLATVIGYFVSAQALPALGKYLEVSQTQDFIINWFWLIFLGLIAIGLLIGDISARLAVRRYLKP